MRSFDESSNNEEASLRVDEQFEIVLEENPSTGYRWRLTDASSAICTVTGDRFEIANSAPGGGGTHRWLFRVTRAGEGAIALEKSRSFEKKGHVQHFRLRILRVIGG